MARPATGSIFWRSTGWYGRYTAHVDGVAVRVTRKLGTDNKTVAKAKLRRLMGEAATGNTAPTADAATRIDTFREAALRVVEQERDEGRKGAEDRAQRLEKYIFATIGDLPVDRVEAHHVVAVLREARDQGLARLTLSHIKADVSVVLRDLCEIGALKANIARDVSVPKAQPQAEQKTAKERAVLTDSELAQYLAWTHPDPNHQNAVLERQVMACVARMFGGLRTGDLHAVRWEGFDTDGGAFTWGRAPRKKTRRGQTLMVPEMLRPILRDWWERAGRPTEGTVFPKLRGDGAGTDPRGGASHAQRLRIDLRRAFGVDGPVEERIRVKDKRCWAGTRELVRRTWRQQRDLTPRERILFEEGEDTRPVDFHSFRRAYAQALADANVNAQQAQALAGHASMAAHERYLRNSRRLLTLPEAALPRLGVSDLRDPIRLGNLVSRGGIEPSTRGFSVSQVPETTQLFGATSDLTREPVASCNVAQPGAGPEIANPDPLARCADAALAGWLRVRADQVAASLGAA